MARTTHGHHIPGTELDEEPYTPASICGGPYGCGQCIEEVRKTPKRGGEMLFVYSSDDPSKLVGWMEVGPGEPNDILVGKPVGDLTITDTDFAKRAMLDLYLRGLIILKTSEENG